MSMEGEAEENPGKANEMERRHPSEHIAGEMWTDIG